MPKHFNPDCGGAYGQPCDHGEVRVLPYPGGNLNVCRAHFMRELRWRQERNKSVASPYALPAWESLRELRERVYCYGCGETVVPVEDDGDRYCPKCDSSDLEGAKHRREPLPEFEDSRDV